MRCLPRAASFGVLVAHGNQVFITPAVLAFLIGVCVSWVFAQAKTEPKPKEFFATRQQNTISLHPETATFRLPDTMVNWFAGFKNNLHLTRDELAKVENGAGDWDIEYGLVCNAVLPFSRCCAHVGEEGWGKDAVSFADLQVRVYLLDTNLDELGRQIEERAAPKVKEITKKPPKITRDGAAGWKRWGFAYDRWYGDYGATANVDFRARRFDGHTVAFVFMYTDYFSQEAKIRSMLESVTWGGIPVGAATAPHSVQPAGDSPQVAKVYSLKHAAGEQVVLLLRSLFIVVDQENAYARFQFDPRTESLIVEASGEHHRQIARILALVDTPDKALSKAADCDRPEQPVRGYPVQRADGEAVASVLRSLFLVVNHRVAYARFGYDPRTHSLIAIASEKHHRQIAKVLELLDAKVAPEKVTLKEGSAEQPIRVYPVKHVDGEQLVMKLRSQFVVVNHQLAEARFGYDERTHTLVVIATEKLHERIRQAIDILDQPPERRQSTGIPDVRGKTKMQRAAVIVGLALAAQAAASGEETNKHYPTNRPPLRQTKFVALPLGAVKPQGWLKDQLTVQAEPGPQPFAQKDAPVVLRVRGRAIPGWTLVDNSAGPLPTSPVASDEPLVELELIPYGCTRLRITEFPLLVR